MKIVQAPRASAILYNLLKSQDNSRPWLLPANICPIVPMTFFKAGVPIEFVDISAETLHMDLEQTEGRLRRGKYGGVLYAHTYGEPSTPVEFFHSVKSEYPNLLLVDDRCLCIPDLEPAQNTSADLVLYSTGYAKVVELNFGGYAFLRDDTPYQPQHLSFNSKAYEQIESKYKQAIQNRSRFVYTDSDWLQTDADLPAWYDYRQQIEDGLKASLRHSAAINKIYTDNLPGKCQLPPNYQTWRFNIRLQNKDQVIKSIFASSSFASSHYASLAGVMAAGQCPQAEKLEAEIINLFNDRYFDVHKAEQITAVILEEIP
ncbi:MAG: hypothetical protein PVJ21_19815 [Anaerolineales bacterium]|jgi:hypothetical protein